MIPLHDDNPTTLKPVVTVALIAASVLVFLWQQSLQAPWQQGAVYALGVTPAVLLGDAQLPEALRWVSPELTVLTSMFLHGGWMHLIGNMLYLWIFGNNIEDALGHGRYVAFYALCGIAAALTQALPHPESEIPMVGASGAISGVLGAYLLLYPHARVLVMVPLGFVMQMMRLPAVWVLGFWFVLQLVSGLMADPKAPGVAFGAHVGGFIAGLVLIPFMKRREVRLWRPARRHWGE